MNNQHQTPVLMQIFSCWNEWMEVCRGLFVMEENGHWRWWFGKKGGGRERRSGEKWMDWQRRRRWRQTGTQKQRTERRWRRREADGDGRNKKRFGSVLLVNTVEEEEEEGENGNDTYGRRSGRKKDQYILDITHWWDDGMDDWLLTVDWWEEIKIINGTNEQSFFFGSHVLFCIIHSTTH